MYLFAITASGVQKALDMKKGSKSAYSICLFYTFSVVKFKLFFHYKYSL